MDTGTSHLGVPGPFDKDGFGRHRMAMNFLVKLYRSRPKTRGWKKPKWWWFFVREENVYFWGTFRLVKYFLFGQILGGFCWIITQHLRKLRWLAGKSLCLRKYIFKLMVVYYSPKNAGTKTHHPSPSLPEICEFEILHSEVSSKVKIRSDSSRFWLLVISDYSARNVSISNIIRTTKSSTQTCLRKRVW